MCDPFSSFHQKLLYPHPFIYIPFITFPLKATHPLLSSLTTPLPSLPLTQVGEALVALKEVGSWMEFCQLNMSALGSHVTILLEELCQLKEEELISDVRNLLGLDLLQVSSRRVLFYSCD